MSFPRSGADRVRDRWVPRRRPKWLVRGREHKSSVCNPAAVSGSSLKSLVAVLMKHRRTASGCMAVGLFAGVLLTLAQTPVYKADATIQILSGGQQEADSVGLASAEDNVRRLETARTKLLSRGLSAGVVTDLSLDENPDFQWSLSRAKLNWPNMANAAVPAEAAVHGQSALETLQQGLSAEVLRNTSLVSVSYRHADPVLAKQILDRLSQRFVEVTAEARALALDQAGKPVAAQISAAKMHLHQAERALVDYVEENGMVLQSVDQTSAMAGIADLEHRLAEAVSDREAHRQLVAHIDEGRAAELETIRQSSVIQAGKIELAALRSEYRQRRATLKPGFPLMRELQAQIGELERQIANETSAAIASIRMEFDRSKAVAARLAGELERRTDEQAAFSQKSIQRAILQRDVEAHRAQYEALLDKRSALDLAANMPAPAAAIVDAPVLPASAGSPRPALNMALAGMLSAFAAAMIIYVREELEDSVSDPEDVSEILDLPVLATTPAIGGAGQALVASQEERAAIEAIRNLRTALQGALPSFACPVLAIASAEQGEGRTTIASLLAREFVAIGYRVLVIDADFRQPAVHSQFNLEIGAGLGNVLVNRRNHLAGGALVQRTPMAMLDVMTTGSVPSEPSNALASERMGLVLEQCRRHYDLILIDTPPVNGFSDTPIVAQWADAVLMLVSRSQVGRSAVIQAAEQLNSAGGRMLGVVLTTSNANRLRHTGSNHAPEPAQMSVLPADDDDIIGWEGYALAETGRPEGRA